MLKKEPYQACSVSHCCHRVKKEPGGSVRVKMVGDEGFEPPTLSV